MDLRFRLFLRGRILGRLLLLFLLHGNWLLLLLNRFGHFHRNGLRLFGRLGLLLRAVSVQFSDAVDRVAEEIDIGFIQFGGGSFLLRLKLHQVVFGLLSFSLFHLQLRLCLFELSVAVIFCREEIDTHCLDRILRARNLFLFLCFLQVEICLRLAIFVRLWLDLSSLPQIGQIFKLNVDLIDTEADCRLLLQEMSLSLVQLL